MHPEDEQLIAGFLHGEPEAVQVIETWMAQAAACYRRRLSAQWSDVLQTIRLEVTRVLRQGAFRGEARLKTYLCCIVNHTCVNQLRAQTQWQRAELCAPERPTAADSPLEELLAQESERLRERIMKAMPADCRRLWAMIRDGLSYQQISQRLGLSDAAVRQRALRCRKQAVALRERWLNRKR